MTAGRTAVLRRIGKALLAGGLVLASLMPASAARAAAHRLTVEAMEYPWSSVGRLNIAGRSYCSATLVSDRHILTAAHCLWNQREGRWWPAPAVHFVAGYQRGEAPLHALVKHYVVADGYAFRSQPRPQEMDRDWALAELEEPLGRQAGWLALGEPGEAATGSILAQAGYRADLSHVLTLDYGCRSLGGVAGGGQGFWSDCQAVHGDSGGPILLARPDGLRVVGITSLAAVAEGRPLTGAVGIAALTDRGRFPQAAQAVAVAGIVARKQAQPPPAGGPVGVGPTQTIRQLGGGGGGSSLSTLAQLLSGGATDTPSR